MTLNRRYFTIIEENGVTETLLAEVQKDQRVDDVFEALKWRIAREPTVGVLVQETGIDYRLVYFRPSKGAKNPYVLARYLVDETAETITIDFIKVYPYDEAIAYTNPAFDIGA